MGVGMDLTPTTADKSQDAWVFIRPFTKEMWFLMAAMSVFSGFVVWFIEHRTNDYFSGSFMEQFGKVLWFSFTTLYLGQRDSLTNNLSRLVMVPWLFLILIVSASYTANLTAMITTSRLVPSTIDIGYLKRTYAVVGCDGSPLSLGYLKRVLGFKAENIKRMASVDEYAEALASGKIRAAFLLSPYAKVFLAKYCRGFTLSGPSYELGGFGFVFPRDSPLTSDFSAAIQNMTESGNLHQLEEDMLSILNCSSLQQDGSTGNQSLGPAPFAFLFILSSGAFVVALLIVIAGLLRKYCQIVTNFPATLMETRIWRWSATILARNSMKTGPVSQEMSLKQQGLNNNL